MGKLLLHKQQALIRVLNLKSKKHLKKDILLNNQFVKV